MWSHLRDLNPRPTVYKTVALPTELRWLVSSTRIHYGGREGIRTPGTVASTPVFKTGAFILSATLPLAEREGFEPSVQSYPYGGLANHWFKPLTHLSTIS